MIVGTGLIARAFAAHQDALAETCVYAAGVSNSSCNDPREFERERQRMRVAMTDCTADRLFMYFSTCSIDDPAAQGSAYVLHKKAMEGLVAERKRHLIFRLPQLAGATPNPHTLLNYLYARIIRSERFEIWSGASRNIIDVDDVARIATDLVVEERACGEIINIANSANSSMFDIVRSMETVLGRRAIFDILDRGAGYTIATDRIQASLRRCRIAFSEDYLLHTIQKYYQHDNKRNDFIQ